MNKLKEVREAKKISQLRLAQASGISRQRIREIENDPDANIRTDTVKKLADALGVSFDDIFFARSVNQD